MFNYEGIKFESRYQCYFQKYPLSQCKHRNVNNFNGNMGLKFKAQKRRENQESCVHLAVYVDFHFHFYFCFYFYFYL